MCTSDRDDALQNGSPFLMSDGYYLMSGNV